MTEASRVQALLVNQNAEIDALRNRIENTDGRAKMIDINKQYRTRDGREVRIYATDGNELKRVHGAFKNTYSGCWTSCDWEASGSHWRDMLLDLIEVRPRHKRTVWLNIYDDSKPALHLSRELADQYRCDRIACIKVELDFEEGEGL